MISAHVQTSPPPRALGCAVVAVLVVAGGRAHANETRIAIESYVGTRPAEVAQAMSYLRGALEKRRFLAQPAALKERLGERVVYPGVADPKFTAQAFSKQAETGLNAVVNEQYELAVRILTAALEGARRNSLVLARDPRSRESRLEALIYLARAYKHLGNTAARDEAMLEILRSYPDRVITAKKYGPDAEEIYEAVKRNADGGGRGRLAVEVTDPEAVIYVDETVRGRSKVLIGDMLPGPHRVLVDGPSGASRQYRVTVLASQHTRLEIDWEIDSVLVTGDWVGFEHATEQDREREGLQARKFARAHTDAVMIAVITGKRVQRRLVVTGAVHTVASGRVARKGQVELTGRGDDNKLDQLAAYLGFEAKAGPDVSVLDPGPEEGEPLPEPAPTPPEPAAAPPAPLPPAPAAPRPPTSHALEWAIGGVGGAAIVTGVLLIALDGTGTCGLFAGKGYCTKNWDTRSIGAATLISGAVLASTGVALHLRHSRRRGPTLAVAPVTGGAVGVVGWSFR